MRAGEGIFIRNLPESKPEIHMERKEPKNQLMLYIPELQLTYSDTHYHIPSPQQNDIAQSHDHPLSLPHHLKMTYLIN